MYGNNQSPCFDEFLKVLKREEPEGRVRFYDLGVDIEVMEKILGYELPSLDSNPEAYLKGKIEFYHNMGHDYVPVGVRCYQDQERLGDTWKRAKDTAELANDARVWAPMGTGPVTNREEYEKYPWADPAQVQTEYLDIAASLLPKGMSIIAGFSCIVEPIVEHIMGPEPLAIALYENPNLVRDVAARLGECAVAAADASAAHEAVGAVCCGDDMGFKTSTIMSPQHLREYALVWHKQAVEAAHLHGKPAILHSCGNLDAIMDDIINYCKYDAKHSYEDIIVPVTEAKKLWGDRIAILGGIDMDVLGRGSEDEVREYVRSVLQSCGKAGYALGTGNTIANYIPVRNYLAMLDEGGKFEFEN